MPNESPSLQYFWPTSCKSGALMTLSSDLIIWLQFRSLRAQSCPTLCDPTDCGPPGSSVNGIFWARILEWVAMPFSGGSSLPGDWTQVSCTAGRFFTTEPLWKLDLLTRWPVYKKEYAGKTEGKRRREWQRMRWLDGITNTMDTMLSKLQETAEDQSLECHPRWSLKEPDTT